MTEIASIPLGSKDYYLLPAIDTPRKSATSTQVDTEGRRSRFRSPPPPPGASPSLLIPTPGRYASNASGLLSDSIRNDIEAMEGEMMPPLKAPVFQLDESLSKSTGNDWLGEKISEGHIITRLCHWSVKFVPVRRPITINENTSNLTHWVIVSGIKQARSSTLQVDQIQTEKEETWRSSLIHERISAILFRTASGSAYELVGPCDIQTTSLKTSANFASLFQHGLPEDWVDLIIKEAHRKGLVGSSDDKTIPRVGSQNLKERKRKALTPPDEEVIPLAQTASQVSSPILSGTSELRQRKQPRIKNSSHQGWERKTLETSKLPKRISRELLQLQSSKLGNLALVQAAILEGMETSTRRESSRNVNKVLADAAENLSMQQDTVIEKSTRKKKRPTLSTPLRTSNRARNAMTEWWKVSSGDVTTRVQKSTVQSKHVRAQMGNSDDPPVKSFGIATDHSDIEISEDEYEQHSTSSEEDQRSRQQVEIIPVRKVYGRKAKVAESRGARKRKGRPNNKIWSDSKVRHRDTLDSHFVVAPITSTKDDEQMLEVESLVQTVETEPHSKIDAVQVRHPTMEGEALQGQNGPAESEAVEADPVVDKGEKVYSSFSMAESNTIEHHSPKCSTSPKVEFPWVQADASFDDDEEGAAALFYFSD